MARLNEYALASETAQILGVSLHTVRVWASDGRIAVFQNPAGGYCMFRREDRQWFLEEPAKAVSAPSRRARECPGQIVRR